MAFDYSPENLLQEVEAACTHRDHYNACNKSLTEVYHGSHFRDDKRPENPSPENYPFSFIANVQPRLVFTNPRFNCASATVALPVEVCDSIGRALNQWARTENLQEKLEPFVTQALLVWSVMLTTFETISDDAQLPAGKMKRMAPKCYQIENHRYFVDPTSTPATPARFQGHMWVRDREDLETLPGIDKATLEELVSDLDMEKLKRPNANSSGGVESPARYEVVGYEVWVPECNDFRTDPKTQNGTVFTLGIVNGQTENGAQKRSKAGFLRKPRPFFGPKWGPYTRLGYYEVPGETYELSPVAVCMQQVEELNAHVVAVANAAARMKNLVFVDASADTLEHAVTNSPDGSVLGVPNISKDQIIAVTVGGPAPEQIQYVQLLRERMDRSIGIDDAQRGDLDPNVTATATNVAYQTMSVRMDYLKKRTNDAVRQLANTAAWYFCVSNNVVMFLSPDDAEELGMSKPVFLGGPQEGQPPISWEHACLEIEPYSMGHVDESQLAQETMETVAIAVQLATEMAQAPWLKWDVILEEMSKVRKLDWLGEVVNNELFIAYQHMQVQQSQQQHQASMAEVEVRLQGYQLDNKLKQMDLLQRARELQQPIDPNAPKAPTVSANYKDLPLDVQQFINVEITGRPSSMPLSTPTHISNAMQVHQHNSGQAADASKMNATHQHQQKQSQLAAMLRQSGQNSGGKMRTAQGRRSPIATAARGGATKPGAMNRPQTVAKTTSNPLGN